jgi:hypothetical protein
LVFLGRGTPVFQADVVWVYLYDRADVHLFLDTTRTDDRFAILALARGSNWGRSDGALVVFVVLLFMAMFVLRSIIIAKVAEGLGRSRSRHELRIDGKRWGEITRGAGGARVGAEVGEGEEIPWRAGNGLWDGGLGVERVVVDVGEVEPKVGGVRLRFDYGGDGRGRMPG